MCEGKGGRDGGGWEEVEGEERVRMEERKCE